MRADLLGGFAGLGGKVFHLGCDDSETFSGFTRACCLYRCVESQQVGLLGDLADQGDNIANLLGRFCQTSNFFVAGSRCFFGFGHRFRGL